MDGVAIRNECNDGDEDHVVPNGDCRKSDTGSNCSLCFLHRTPCFFAEVSGAPRVDLYRSGLLRRNVLRPTNVNVCRLYHANGDVLHCRLANRRVTRDVERGRRFVYDYRYAIVVATWYVGLRRKIRVRRLGPHPSVRVTAECAYRRHFQDARHVEIAVKVQLTGGSPVLACASGVCSPDISASKDCFCAFANNGP